MILPKIVEQIRLNINAIIDQTSGIGESLWHELLKMHPADIVQLFASLDRTAVQRLFLNLPEPRRLAVFTELSYSMKVFCLSFLDDHDRGYLLGNLPIDELTDFFDELSDEELKEYLKLLHKKDREQVLSLMQFNPESAGGIMDSNVLTLMQDFTVEKSIQILQRLQPSRDLHQKIFVTNQENQLVGYINLEDLVLKHPQTRLASIIRENELIVNVHQDREEVAKQMVHYNLMTVPVVDNEGTFLGVISSATLVEIIEEEASEDIYRMSALTPMKYTYFETSFWRLLLQRSSILMILLLAQTFSSMIIMRYEALLTSFFMLFMPMLISAGGNSSNQTSALVIQGLAAGEMTESDIFRFLRREFCMATMIALLLGTFTWLRILWTHEELWGGLIVGLSLSIIVLVSIMLGSCMPFILKKFKMDPAHSAGPLLATLMDIIGILIYCYVIQLILP